VASTIGTERHGLTPKPISTLAMLSSRVHSRDGHLRTTAGFGTTLDGALAHNERYPARDRPREGQITRPRTTMVGASRTSQCIVGDSRKKPNQGQKDLTLLCRATIPVTALVLMAVLSAHFSSYRQPGGHSRRPAQRASAGVSLGIGV
jgi:hypothetical protein